MTITYYYVTGNTAKGFVNFLPSNLNNIKQIFVLKHPSHTLKTEVIEMLIKQLDSEIHLEIILSALGDKYTEGVIVREKSVAILTDTIATAFEGNKEILNLEKIIDQRFYNKRLATDVASVEKQLFKEHTQAAYDNFATGLSIHDQLESIFINKMNFKKADEVAEDFITKMLKDVEKRDRTPHIYRRLFGTNTSEGAVNVVPELLADIKRNFYIKGRAGTGKSTFMKKVITACKAHGFELEIYYCSFDPNSIDMVIVRDLDFSIFDSTDPHEFFPKRDGEEIIDMYELTVVPGTDEEYADDIKRITNEYKSYMKKGISHLKQARLHFEKLEEQYTFTNDNLEHITRKIIASIN